jgi:hypothetical protein
MLRKTSVALAAMVAGFCLVSGASAEAPKQHVVYLGGHNPAQLYRTVPTSQAPYALTGEQTGSERRGRIRFEQIFTGSRFVGVRQIGN